MRKLLIQKTLISWCQHIIHLNLAAIIKKTWRSFYQYTKDKSNAKTAKANFTSVQPKNEITCSTLAANNVKNVTIVVPLEYICIFDKTLKVLWNYSWNNMILKYVIKNVAAEGNISYKWYVTVVSLSAEKTLSSYQLNSGLKKIVYWIKNIFNNTTQPMINIWIF